MSFYNGGGPQRTFGDTGRPFIPYVTYTVAALSIALSAAYWMNGEQVGSFGQVPLERIWSGEWGGLITSTMLHANPKQNPLHILFNLLCLIQLGPMVERALGRLEYGVFLAFAALVGTGIQVAVTSHESVGLSGVVYAVWGLCWAARRTDRMFEMVSTRQMAQYMIGWLVLGIALSSLGWMHMANAAHVGGLLFGVSIGWLFVDKGLAPRYRYAGGALLAALAVTTALSVSYLPWSARWRAWKAASSAATTTSMSGPDSSSAPAANPRLPTS